MVPQKSYNRKHETQSRRTKTSPYLEPKVIFKIGPDQQPCEVPRPLLRESFWDGTKPCDTIIELPELDPSTGHALIHYLYTGYLQMLGNTYESWTIEKKVSFNNAFSAYITAKKYSLPDLATQAMQEMEMWTTTMDFFQIIDAIQDVYSRYTIDLSEFAVFLTARASEAFKKDRTAFAKDDLFDGVTDLALSKILMRLVMKLYRDEAENTLDKTMVKVGTLEESRSTKEAQVDEVVSDGVSIQDDEAEKKLAEVGVIDDPRVSESDSKEDTTITELTNPPEDNTTSEVNLTKFDSVDFSFTPPSAMNKPFVFRGLTGPVSKVTYPRPDEERAPWEKAGKEAEEEERAWNSYLKASDDRNIKTCLRRTAKIAPSPLLSPPSSPLKLPF